MLEYARIQFTISTSNIYLQDQRCEPNYIDNHHLFARVFSVKILVTNTYLKANRVFNMKFDANRGYIMLLSHKSSLVNMKFEANEVLH